MSEGSDTGDDSGTSDGSDPSSSDREVADSEDADVSKTPDAPSDDDAKEGPVRSGTDSDVTDSEDDSDSMTADDWAENNPYSDNDHPGLTPAEAQAESAAQAADEEDETAVVTDGAAPTGAPDSTDNRTGAIDPAHEDDEGLFGDGPESDEEMPLAEHIDEMMRRLAAVFLVAGIASLAVLLLGTTSPTIPSAEEIILFLWDRHIGFEQNRPRVYGPLEFLLTKLKVVGLAGVLVGLPALVYQAYLFMRPGLYPHERRYYLAAVPTSLVLAAIGMAFAHFVILPAVFDYFVTYTDESAVIAFGLRETFNLILILMGYMAVVFQVPLLVQLAIMMNIVTREWMEERRLLIWGAFATISFTFVAVDPTGMVPIIIGATMIVLFEGTLALLRWTGN